MTCVTPSRTRIMVDLEKKPNNIAAKEFDRKK